MARLSSAQPGALPTGKQVTALLQALNLYKYCICTYINMYKCFFVNTAQLSPAKPDGENRFPQTASKAPTRTTAMQ